MLLTVPTHVRDHVDQLLSHATEDQARLIVARLLTDPLPCPPAGDVDDVELAAAGTGR